MDPLAERARNGDKDAMAEIVRRYYADVFRFCSRLIGAQAAEDASQEAFINASKRIKTYRAEASIRTWLFGIAVNVCRNERRKMKDTLPLQDWDMAQNPASALIDAQALRTALSRLDDEHRETVVLHELEGLTYEECATALGVPCGTIKSRLHYAFLKLRTLLAEKEIAR